jgi:small subunit ribosomal protein S18
MSSDLQPGNTTPSGENRPESTGNTSFTNRSQNRAGSDPAKRQGGGGGRRFYNRRKVCFWCANKDSTIDFKNPESLRQYLSERARIEPRRKTGTCAKHQRILTKHIKRSRQLGLLPYTTDTLKNFQPRR